MNSYTILFLIAVSLVAYSLVATYLFWLMRHDLRFLERTGKNQAEALSIIAEANKRIDRLEDKRKYKTQATNATPRTPRPLQGKQTNDNNND